MRLSTDQRDAKGRVVNGFDYALQVWVRNGIVATCAHPAPMRRGGTPCCNQHRYAGRDILTIPGHERTTP